MHAIEVLADPVRRRLVELLADGPRSAGELAEAVGQEFSISQPASSRHLRVLRESELVTSEVDGQRRLYRLEPAPFDELEQWLSGVRAFWDQRLDALGTEVARGKGRR